MAWWCLCRMSQPLIVAVVLAVELAWHIQMYKRVVAAPHMRTLWTHDQGACMTVGVLHSPSLSLDYTVQTRSCLCCDNSFLCHRRPVSCWGSKTLYFAEMTDSRLLVDLGGSCPDTK